MHALTGVFGHVSLANRDKEWTIRWRPYICVIYRRWGLYCMFFRTQHSFKTSDTNIE